MKLARRIVGNTIVLMALLSAALGGFALLALPIAIAIVTNNFAFALGILLAPLWVTLCLEIIDWAVDLTVENRT